MPSHSTTAATSRSTCPPPLPCCCWGERPEDAYYARRALGAAALSDPVVKIRTGLFCQPRRQHPRWSRCDRTLQPCAAEHGAKDSLGRVRRRWRGRGPLSRATQRPRLLQPRPLARPDPRALQRTGSARLATRPTIKVLDADEPHHRLFNDLLASDEDQPRFYAYFAMVPAPDLLPLARFGDGQLAMALAWKEQGRVALAAFPIDPQWNDLHQRGLFAPLLHRLVRELSLPPERHTAYLVGETIYRRLADVPMEAVVEAETPSGERLRLEPERVGGQYLWKIPQVGEAGIWRLHVSGTEVDAFAVNFDARESALAPVVPEYVRSVFGRRRSPFPQPGRRPASRGLGQPPRQRAVARIPAFGPRPPPRRTVDRPCPSRRSGASGGIKKPPPIGSGRSLPKVA